MRALKQLHDVDTESELPLSSGAPYLSYFATSLSRDLC